MNLPSSFNNIPKLLKDLKTKPEEYWLKRGEHRALKLFHQMATRVPAYKDFLKKHHLNHNTIKNIKDFKKVPLISKDNYLRKYPLEKLCWDGDLQNKRTIISSTSGSTGMPFYFPRGQEQDLQYAAVAEMYLRDVFDIHKKSTLYIDAFPMGPWIGGVFTYSAIRIIAERGNYSLSIITTGISKEEIIKAVKKFGKKYDQILIGCYAPFLKDAVDDGVRQGLRWQNYNIKFIFSAEGFNEHFRDYIIKKTGLAGPFLTNLNMYGTVDLGTMAHETPFTILIRRLALKKEKIYKEIFGNIFKLPTLTQYLPELFYFEEVDRGLVCSSYSGLPLVRYDLKDHGGVIKKNILLKILKKNKINFLKQTRKERIKNTVWNIPCVYVYERSDLSVSIYAFQVYPETIRRALQSKKIEDSVTGKFTMMVKYTKNLNQYLEINVELKGEVLPSERMRKMVGNLIMRHLLNENSEYRKTHSEINEKIYPKVILWPYEDTLHFKPGIKQKWVKK